MIGGRLQPLELAGTDPVTYALRLDGAQRVELNPLLNNGLAIHFDGTITCLACGASTARSYGDGHCYGCFKRLARCDLCVVSPARCHFHQGTCREPDWGEAFCMVPHVVYLANSSGPKVGITRAGGELARWRDQGATQGLVVARTATRRLAGLLEVQLATRISDRTDWRRLVAGDARPVDLVALANRLRPPAGALPDGTGAPPDGVVWAEREAVVELAYPIAAYPPPEQLELVAGQPLVGRLCGMKGQYLLFDHGVLNVRRHRAYHVRLEVLDARHPALSQPRSATAAAPQMELFP